MEFLKEIGTNLFMGGFVLVGANKPLVILTPDSELIPSMPMEGFSNHMINCFSPTESEYKDIIRQMDLMEIELTDSLGRKVIVRKSQRQGDHRVTWEVFRRDEFRCRYCGVIGGDNGSTLSYDHVKLWEDGGEWSVENGVTACTKCNRQRGNVDYGRWIRSSVYQRKSVGVQPKFLEMNNALLEVYQSFPERASKRGR